MSIASPKKANSPWFVPVCDELYLKVALWDEAYKFGEVHSTCQYLEKDGQVINKPTRYAHRIPFRLVELEHLIRIIEDLKPGSTLVEELEQVKAVWKYGKPVMGNRYMLSYWSKIILPHGVHRLVTLAFYPEHVKEIRNILKEAKTGQTNAALEQIMEEKKQAGKDLFEE